MKSPATSDRDRIIVQQLHGHWSSWWEDEPQVAFGGATPAERADRLLGFAAAGGTKE